MNMSQYKLITKFTKIKWKLYIIINNIAKNKKIGMFKISESYFN